jgi:hypothetical protein
MHRCMHSWIYGCVEGMEEEKVETRGSCHDELSMQLGADQQKTTARGCGPSRAGPDGSPVHHLSHSVTLP